MAAYRIAGCQVSRSYRLLKRLLDLKLASVGMLCLIPLGSLIALLIRLDSKGPATFKQERIGKAGVPFMVYKFRTMTIDSESYGPKPFSFNDDRLTRVGYWLRRLSLDELPQVINVFKGEMSIVGPRPEQPFLVAQYEPWQKKRLGVLPGLTGWWQVNGRKQPMHAYIEEDLYYIRHQSLWFDAKIILLTIRAVFTAEGAI